jgi:hypothetical protein
VDARLITWYTDCNAATTPEEQKVMCKGGEDKGERNEENTGTVKLLRMSSSGILRRVALLRTDVSEERIASITRATAIGELEITLAVARNRSTQPSSPVFLTLMMDTICSSESSVLTRPTWCNIQEGNIFHSHRRENLKSYIVRLLQKIYTTSMSMHKIIEV